MVRTDEVAKMSLISYEADPDAAFLTSTLVGAHVIRIEIIGQRAVLRMRVPHVPRKPVLNLQRQDQQACLGALAWRRRTICPIG